MDFVMPQKQIPLDSYEHLIIFYVEEFDITLRSEQRSRVFVLTRFLKRDFRCGQSDLIAFPPRLLPAKLLLSRLLSGKEVKLRQFSRECCMLPQSQQAYGGSARAAHSDPHMDKSGWNG
jgi:hypothetical protein